MTPEEAQLMKLSDSSVLLSLASFCNIYIAWQLVIYVLHE